MSGDGKLCKVCCEQKFYKRVHEDERVYVFRACSLTLVEDMVVKTDSAPRSIAMGCQGSNLWMIRDLDHIYYCTLEPFRVFAKVVRGKESKQVPLSCLKSFIKGEIDFKEGYEIGTAFSVDPYSQVTH